MNKTKPPDKEVLSKLYITENLTMREISQRLGLSIGSVYNYIHKYAIPAREQYKGMLGKHHSEETKALISKRHTGRVISEESRRRMSESMKKGGIGHKKKRRDGYIAIYFPDHPKCAKDGYIMEHDLIMECLIGRTLRDDEVVHHINKNRDDNRKENLQLMTFKEHSALHMRERYAQRRNDLSTK